VQLKRSRKFGDFVWPADLDPETWTGYRASTTSERSLDEVAPQEIANAMRALIAESSPATEDDLLRATADVFGIARLGGNIRSRLEAVRKAFIDQEPSPAPVAQATTEAPASTPQPSSGASQDIVGILRNALESGQQGVFEVGRLGIAWQGDPSTGLLLTISSVDGALAVDDSLVEALVSVGWRRPRPADGLPHPWVELRRWPDEADHHFAGGSIRQGMRCCGAALLVAPHADLSPLLAATFVRRLAGRLARRILGPSRDALE